MQNDNNAMVPDVVSDTIAKPIPDKKGMALASFILGLVSIITWFIPLFGAPTTIIGLILGILGLKSSRKKMAIAGIILSGLFLIATIVNSVAGAILFSKALQK